MSRLDRSKALLGELLATSESSTREPIEFARPPASSSEPFESELTLNESFRTRTMAEIAIDQGHVALGVEIFDELLLRALSQQERVSLYNARFASLARALSQQNDTTPFVPRAHRLHDIDVQLLAVSDNTLSIAEYAAEGAGLSLRHYVVATGLPILVFACRSQPTQVVVTCGASGDADYRVIRFGLST